MCQNRCDTATISRHITISHPPSILPYLIHLFSIPPLPLRHRHKNGRHSSHHCFSECRTKGRRKTQERRKIATEIRSNPGDPPVAVAINIYPLIHFQSPSIHFQSTFTSIRLLTHLSTLLFALLFTFVSTLSFVFFCTVYSSALNSGEKGQRT